VYLQSDPRWRDEPLGHGTTTIGHAGCVLTSVASAAHARGHTQWTPHALNATMRALPGGFVRRDLLSVQLAALTVGLSAPYLDKVQASPGDTRLYDCLAASLLRSEMALLRIDRTDDGRGDHTILAKRAGPGGTVECWDPARGAMALASDLTWQIPGTSYRYRVTAVHPIRG
jgi:hypothetical protein